VVADVSIPPPCMEDEHLGRSLVIQRRRAGSTRRDGLAGASLADDVAGAHRFHEARGSRDLPDTLAQMFDRNTEQRPGLRETRGHDGAIAALGDSRGPEVTLKGTLTSGNARGVKRSVGRAGFEPATRGLKAPCSDH
jgi:hypothetical protein